MGSHCGIQLFLSAGGGRTSLNVSAHATGIKVEQQNHCVANRAVDISSKESRHITSLHTYTLSGVPMHDHAHIAAMLPFLTHDQRM